MSTSWDVLFLIESECAIGDAPSRRIVRNVDAQWKVYWKVQLSVVASIRVTYY